MKSDEGQYDFRSNVNKLLRNELSAVETYQQASGEDRLGHEAEFEQLAAILNNIRTEASDVPNLLEAAVVGISRTFHADAGSVPEQARG